MRRIILYCALLVLLLTGAVGAQSTTQSGYCTSLFQNQLSSGAGASGVSGNVVSAAFSGSGTASGSPIPGILDTAFIIVMLVLILLSALYAIGMGFGISKLVAFVKTEYIESFFNIIIILAIFGGVAAIGGYSSFFTKLPGLGGLGQYSVPSSSGGLTYNLYTGICTNIINEQVLPSLLGLVSLTVQQPLYSAAESFVIGVTPSASAGYIPGFSIQPLNGLHVYYELILFELSPLIMIIFLGIAVIFLFFVIFFLFPIFLYAGILLRSFPWTRAAGGSLLALFIAFYVVFPALYYPFTAAVVYQTSGTAQSNPECSMEQIQFAAEQGTYACLDLSGVWSFITGVTTRLSTFISAAYSLLNGGGNAFVTNLDVYVGILADAIVELLGLGIAFIISFDLLEALGDLLGSPSLQSSRLLERII